MKIRHLLTLLNNTGYTVSNHDTYLAIGGPYCHDLLAVDVKTLKIKIALDTFREGRKYLQRSNGEMLFIYDTLVKLIESNQIQDILIGDDEIENPIDVYTVKNGELIKTQTDKVGWPNLTKEGWLMYDNTFFTNIDDAIDYGIREYTAWKQLHIEQLDELKEKIKEREEKIEHCTSVILTLLLKRE